MAIEDRDDPPNPYKIPTIRTRMGYSQVNLVHTYLAHVARAFLRRIALSSSDYPHLTNNAALFFFP